MSLAKPINVFSSTTFDSARHVPFNALRKGRTPSEACASRCHLTFIRIEAIPAVYRAPGLPIGTVLVMNSQGFADKPEILLSPTRSQHSFEFHSRRSPRCILETRTSIYPILGGFVQPRIGEAEIFGSTTAFLRGLRFFSSWECHHSIPDLISWFHQATGRIPVTDIIFQCSPSSPLHHNLLD